MERIGLIGLPNTGKSSFFRLLTNKNVLIADYCFSTINPEVSSFKVYDKRVERIASFFKKPKLVFSELKISDIPGIVKNSQANSEKILKFISQIRECDAIIIVLRFFKNENIIHSEGSYNPFRDFETLSIELILSDLEQINKKIEKNNMFLKKNKVKNTKIKEENEILKKVENDLNMFQYAFRTSLTKNEKDIIRPLELLTNKQFILIANYDKNDDNWENKISEFKKKFSDFSILEIDVKNEIEKLEENKNIFKNEILFENIKRKLELKTFFTAGETEIRSWITKKHSNAKKCANMIHSEISNNLVKVNIINESKYKEKNDLNSKIRLENKDYLVEDGDICDFIYSIKKSKKTKM